MSGHRRISTEKEVTIPNETGSLAPFQILAYDIKEEITHYLSIKEILTVTRACKNWRDFYSKQDNIHSISLSFIHLDTYNQGYGQHAINKLNALTHLEKLNLYFDITMNEQETKTILVSLLAYVQLPRLKALSIHSQSLTQLPKWLARPPLETLKLICQKLTLLPDWIGEFTNLQTLDIDCSEELKASPDLFLNSLLTLNFNANISDPFAELSQEGVAAFPEIIHNFPALEVLSFNVFSYLEELPRWIGDFSSLHTLKLLNCDRFSCFPEEMKKLTKLRTLELSNGINFSLLLEDATPKLPSSLQVLVLDKWRGFARFDEVIKKFASLKKLVIRGSMLSPKSSDPRGQLDSGQTLEANSCPDIEELQLLLKIGDITFLFD